jgi:magnesium transporter
MGFLVICVGITILQMSKVDPTQFKNLDRRTTILLQASRKQTEAVEEKSLSGMEEPGIDTLRGSFGTVGSIIRARSARRISQSSRTTNQSSRLGAPSSRFDVERGDSKSSSSFAAENLSHYGGMRRHQLFDPPVPVPESDAISMSSHPSVRKPAIKFGGQDVVHSYHRGTVGKDDLATHERRVAPHSSSPLASPVQANFLPENVSGSRLHLQQSPPRVDLGDNEPRSAPAGVGVAEGAYRDPFEGAPASATLIIPLDGDQSRRNFSRQGSSRDYPRGDRADDAEERVSLWDPRREDSEEMDVATSPESSLGTIRLVGSSRPGRF